MLVFCLNGLMLEGVFFLFIIKKILISELYLLFLSFFIDFKLNWVEILEKLVWFLIVYLLFWWCIFFIVLYVNLRIEFKKVKWLEIGVLVYYEGWICFKCVC